MLYTIKIDKPFLCVAIDLSTIDVIELHRNIGEDQYNYHLNFYKADVNDAILSYDLTGLDERGAVAVFTAVVNAKSNVRQDFVDHD